MSAVQIEQKSYEMPPREGISIAQFLTVADIERSARYYEKVFGARILSLGDGNAPGYLQLENIWMILNVGGGPTPDKPTVTLSLPDPNHINSFLNMRVADIQACYKLWKSRGAEFITEPIPKYGEIRCYIRDPDGYIIEVGQSTDQVLLTGGDMENPAHRSNAQRAMERLLGLRILPIVNENDTVATQEIRFGDNDRLAALVAELIDADLLVLLSDVDALYTRPPHETGAERIAEVPFGDELRQVTFGDIGAAGVGSGGAGTKVAAARHAAAVGTPVLLAETRRAMDALAGADLGTWFSAAESPQTP